MVVLVLFEDLRLRKQEKLYLISIDFFLLYIYTRFAYKLFKVSHFV